MDVASVFEKMMQDQDLQDWIISIITLRLYNEGVGSDDKKLITNKALRNKKNGYDTGFYSSYTKKIKEGKNQKTDNVTLSDTKDFYTSFAIKATKKNFQIKADFKKKDGDIADNFTMSYTIDEFKKNILNLSKPELQFFVKDKLKRKIIYLLKKIMRDGRY
jgi:hypothetical protein